MEAQREAFLHCRGKNPVALLRRHETQHGGSAQARYRPKTQTGRAAATTYKKQPNKSVNAKRGLQSLKM